MTGNPFDAARDVAQKIAQLRTVASPDTGRALSLHQRLQREVAELRRDRRLPDDDFCED